jgi:hypothetical protein
MAQWHSFARAAAASYEAADRYVLFELTVSEARCNGYGDVALPDPRRWRDPEADAPGRGPRR